MGLFFREIDAGTLIVGAVTRGSGALDGVISGVLGSLGARELSAFLKESRQLGQVRVIVYESVDGVDSFLLSEGLGKPVLELVPEHLFDEMMTLRVNGLVVKPVGIDGPSTLRVLKVISRGDGVPALEMAGKIADSLQ